MEKKKWDLRSIILLTLISIACGLIFFLTDFLSNGLQILLTPIGLQPVGSALLGGLWMFAAPLAAMLLRRPGAALCGEVLAAIVEMLVGSQFGVMAIVDGIISGLGYEIGFAATGYKKYNHITLSLGAILSAVITFVWDWFQRGYASYSMGMLVTLFIVHLISIWVFSDPFVVQIDKLLKKSKVVKS